MTVQLYTIGFTRKNAETFFGLIRAARIKTLIDVRLNNSSQLAGFAKRDDLRFLLRELSGTDYVHLLELAPTKEMLDPYRKGELGWDAYAARFLDLMARRNVERLIAPALLEQGCLLCSEHQPHHCHRRLVAEYLQQTSGVELSVQHLL
jgi:uncharacterized protein (DUF488 family)